MDPLADLFDRWRSHGDLQALGAVFDALAPRLLPVALHLCGHAADAEDAVQQTFLLAMDRGTSFDAGRRLEPWLAGLLQNVVRNQVRRAGQRRTEPLPECASDELGPIAAAERAELVARLRTHVDALPAEQRQVVRLQLQHGLSPTAIAEALELPPGTVRMRLHRGLEALRRLLPASLAALLAASLSSRGLAAVKHVVMHVGAKHAAAAVAAAATGSVAMVGGTLAMKKLAALFVVVVTAGALWWWSALPPLDASRHEPLTLPPAPAPAETGLQPTANAPGEVVSREAAPALSPAIGADAGPSPTEIFGVVVDAITKAPVAGADVQLQHCMNDEFSSLDLAQGQRVATVGRAASDGAGRFRFDVERARPHRLRVAAAGYADAVLYRRCGGSTVEVALTRGAAVSGVVMCKEQLLADMDVRIAVVGEGEVARGRTDTYGAFRFAGLAPASVFVQVGSPRFADNWKKVELEAGKEHQFTIEMTAGKTLRGRVLDAATSMPVFDAEVTDSWVFRRVVRTDTEGRFALAGLRDEGVTMLHVRAHGYARATTNVSGKLGDELVVKLQRGGEVTGRAVDPDGRGLGDAYVAVCASYRVAQGFQGSDWIAATVGADGRFQAVGLRPDQHYWLLVRRDGCGARVHALPRVLVAGERHDVGDVVMRRGAGIEGRVVDDAGQPIEGVSVEVRGTNDDSRRWLASGANPTAVSQFEDRGVRTDARGVFRITGLAAGTFHVTARRSGSGKPAARDVVTADGALQEDVVLVLPRGLAISGTLLLATGLPPGDDAVGAISLFADGPNGGHFGRVAADGSFRFDDLPDGEFTIAAPGTPKGFVLTPVAGVKAGAQGLRLVLEASATLAGRVVDASGKPKKARVYTVGGAGLSRFHPTDDAGRFQIDVPASFRGGVAAVGVGIDDERLRAQVDDVAAGRTDLVLELR